MYLRFLSFEKSMLLLFLLLILHLLLIIIFTTCDLLIFYIAFEAVLIPMIFLIGFFGSRARRIFATYYFFLYTFFGSLFLLFAIIFLFITFGTFDYFFIQMFLRNVHFNTLTLFQEHFLWCCFFIAFAVKFPLYPFHIWLPEAHVEASTVGSVMLAGILLKLGGYGILRFCLIFFPSSSLFFQKLVIIICLFGCIHASFIALRQIDLKRIIAYASIAHMHFVLLGLFLFDELAFNGALFLMFSHSFIAAGLFFLVGYLYEFYGSRLIFYYRGLLSVMPRFVFHLLLLLLANLGFPTTSGFIGEFLIILGLINQNFYSIFWVFFSFFLSAIYSFRLYTKLSFGNLSFQEQGSFCDIPVYLAGIFTILNFCNFFFGLFPTIILILMERLLFSQFYIYF